MFFIFSSSFLLCSRVVINKFMMRSIYVHEHTDHFLLPECLVPGQFAWLKLANKALAHIDGQGSLHVRESRDQELNVHTS